MLNKVVQQVTERIIKRSEATRAQYMQMMHEQEQLVRDRNMLTCSNLAHVSAGNRGEDQSTIISGKGPLVGIISAYNDMLSAHCPFKVYPDEIKATVRGEGAAALVASGVPAMCDGVTQGQPGMDMSLFSRDIIAQGVAVGLSHNVFDATLLLGICDKIAPGLVMGAAAFGHLPTAFVPAGPMSTGISNEEKTAVRQQYAAGKLDKQALQQMECQSYHDQGTCTFYGTANTNQLVLEAMGLMLPGSAFVPPYDPRRKLLTAEIAKRIVKLTHLGDKYRPLYQVLDVKNFVNGIVAWLASGGSTNHTLHIIAMARAAGIIITWQDFSELSEAVPLLVSIYPNAKPDINALQAAGGVPVLLNALHKRGLVHEDVLTCVGTFADQLTTPILEDGKLVFVPCGESKDPSVLISGDGCFKEHGGIKVLDGNLGRSVIKISAVAPEHHHVKAKARVFDSQHDVEKAYKEGKLNEDAVIVVRFAGPAAAGMPELHKLMPVLGNLQKAGYHVALLTDGRLSGASGKIPSALHVCPEALRGGPLAYLRDGDLIDFDADNGTINCLTSWEGREPAKLDTESLEQTYGRYLFKACRKTVSTAEEGATFLF
ncbi:MAG: phosphogluconate dehydratase [Candidatus Anaerobiospirillum merdipullorum]|uniref:Phosphogluconate dehydratase n=1 Tax=Candidatus Anaerobiospirillum merdipullorum TaxID=2838450 RepID=A0A9E2NRU0_9GAMM|nr:phosphogluconate dehydratase [Candidatus Anaerobiospirillum merdipullorum]